MLNIPQAKLYMEIIPKRRTMLSGRYWFKNLIKIPKNTAMKKLLAGPAKATLKFPHFLSLKLLGFTGTGFVHPNMGPFPPVAINKNKGTNTEPNRSKCGKGFKVNLPESFAVGSTKYKAMLPWAISWMTIDNNRTINVKIGSITSIVKIITQLEKF